MKMPKLKTLDCYSCWEIWEESVARVLNDSDDLASLNVSYCRRITKNLIDAAKDSIERRDNGTGLKIYLEGTGVHESDVTGVEKSLKLEFKNGLYSEQGFPGFTCR